MTRFKPLIPHVRSGAAVLAAVLCAAPAANAQPVTEKTTAPPPAGTPGGPGSLHGVWINSNFKTVRTGGTQDGPVVLNAADGKPIPLLPETAKVVATRIAGSTYKDDATQRCTTPGMPFAISSPAQSPLQIVETPKQKQITVLYEQFTTFRIIRMDAKHPAHPKPSAMGDAVGHWDGDTLVVDTIAVSDKTSVREWIPHSSEMHLVERIRRTGPDTIQDLLTIDDPKTFSRPWEMVAQLRHVPGMQLAEFVCDNPG